MSLTSEEREAAAARAETYPPGWGGSWMAGGVANLPMTVRLLRQGRALPGEG